MSRKKIYELITENGGLWMEQMEKVMGMMCSPITPKKKLDKMCLALIAESEEKLLNNYKALFSEIDETIFYVRRNINSN